MFPWRGSNAGVFLGDESPVRLHERRDAILDLIRSLRGQVRDEFELHAESPFRNHLFADGSSNVAILGERGSGKTALLFAVCAHLIEEDRDLVLPPMRPELFSPNESVISAFLASLWSALVYPQRQERLTEGRKGQKEQDPGPKPDPELVTLLADSARSFAAFSTSREALAHATDSTVDYAEDATAISRSGARLPSQLAELARLICMADEKKPRQVIVPIDDPDLAPDKVTAILKNLRVLGSIPGIVPIASFCQEDLAEAWRGSQVGEGKPDNVKLARLFERELEKLFPYRSRFEIQPLDVLDRVEFRPVGEKETLRDKLGQLRRVLDRQDTRWPIDETLTQTPKRYGLPNPLPSNARALVQLWTTLEQIDPERDVSWETFDQTLSHLCTLLSEPLRMTLGLAAGKSFYAVELRANESGKSRSVVRMELEGLQLYVVLSSQVISSVDQGQNGSIGLHRIVQVKGSHTMDAGGTEKRMTLAPDAVASLLAFNEIALGSGRFLLEGEGLWQLDNQDWTGGQEVVVGGLPTDDRFLRLPEASTFGEVVETVDAWNALVEIAEGEISAQDLLAASLATSLQLVGESNFKKGAGSYEELFDAATAAYLQRKDRSDRPSTRFCKWYETELPMQWHDGFFANDFLRKCCAIYRNVTEDVFDREDKDASFVGPRSVIESRLKYILDAAIGKEEEARYCWIAGYFELAMAIQSIQLEKLSSLSKPWRTRLTALRAGSSSASQFVTRSAGERRLAPFATPEGLELFLRARALLRQRVTEASRKASRRGR